MWQDKSEFKDAVKSWADKLNIKAHAIAIRPMKNKYVIVHELLHFRYPNHGRVWKSLMTAYLGDYEKTEKKLKKIVSQQKHK